MSRVLYKELLLHLIDTFLANDTTAKLLNVISISTKNACRFIFFKNYLFSVNVYFQSIFYFNTQGPP